ncbi:YesL family protein [Geobacillus sp. PK12]|uniref:YesL n=1 Tax=Geobacillus thermodenitrificans TaxID=33940 RepID=A0A291I5Q9_GEOTD|nr:YesL family protein [Geobacillus sp. PK12]ATG84594.1 YesL [Geobacillus thermodenitrificans]RXS90458.1 DUF624 domain-containing protein [Geobacillus sp. PK12]
MRTGLLDGKLYRICEWISRLAYINILWILFTIIGFVLLGFAPATVALFTIVRKWLLFHDDDVPIFKTFIQTYKSEFWRANRIGLLLMAMAYVFSIDVLYIGHLPAVWRFPFIAILPLVLIFYTVALLYVFPLYVHYELRFWQYIKYAFLIGMVNPFRTIGVMISIGALLIALVYIPGLIPFFGISLLALIVMGNALQVFRKTEEKQVAMRQVE